MKRLRVGVLGAGWFASRRHIPDILADHCLELAAICRRDKDALQRMADAFHPSAVYTDWQQMVETEMLDIAVISSPHSLHYPMAEATLKRGVHVLLEKPMTIRADHAEALHALAQSRGLYLATAYNPPFWAHCDLLRNRISEGRLGALESISMYWTGNASYVFGEAPKPDNLPGTVPPTLFRADPEQCGGGYLIDGGSHLISELLWVTGLRAERVSCWMDNPVSDRRSVLSVVLENGAVASINCVGDSLHGERRVRNVFGGSRGTATVDGFDFATEIRVKGCLPETFRENELPQPAGPLANLVEAVRKGSPLRSGSQHGVQVTRLIEAASVSAREKRWVEIQ
jgi:predicted dehydrogenase